MTRTLVLRTIVVCVMTFALATRAYALFGLGDIVFDPSNYAQAVQQVLRMEQQYVQLVQSYQMLRNQYEHLARMARQVPVDMAGRYRALATPWEPFSARDTYGTTGAWITAINTGRAMAAGYNETIERLTTYGAALKNLPSGQVDRVKATYGSVELADGANVNALSTIGSLRGNAIAVESAIQRLEDDSLSSAPEMNTEIAVLNKINAAGVVAVRAAQDTNRLLVAVAEQQVLIAKRARDAEARAINQHIRFVTQGRAVVTAQAAGASQAMRDWRMP